MHTKPLALGTYMYPYKTITDPFIEIFNYYDSYPNYNMSIFIAANTPNAIPWNFKNMPLAMVDKNITVGNYNQTSQWMPFITATDSGKISHPHYLAPSSLAMPSLLYSLLNKNKPTYDFNTKLNNGIISDVQNSMMSNYPVNAIRSSLKFNNLKIGMNLTTVDVNQEFLLMNQASYQSLIISNCLISIQGILADITDAITTLV